MKKIVFDKYDAEMEEDLLKDSGHENGGLLPSGLSPDDFSCYLIEAPSDSAGERLDRFLASLDLGLSRSRIKGLILDGNIRVGGSPVLQASHRLRGGETIELSIPPPEPMELIPCPVDFEVLYEDEHLIVLNKPAGLVVHPGAGREEKTLVHGLLHRCKDLSGIGGVMRPGIVHRLDKDTSGVMVVAKSAPAHEELAAAFKRGDVKKSYLAMVRGHMPAKKGEIDLPIGRHKIKRKKMTVNAPRSRPAITRWRVLEEFPGASLLSIRILTGRTHQIRAHMESVGHSLLGDPLYGGPRKVRTGGIEINVPRQMLHSSELVFTHPIDGLSMEFEAPPPDDFNRVLQLLRGT